MGKYLMKTSQAGRDLIKSFEGLHDGDKRTPLLEPQICPTGHPTLGWGSTFDLRGCVVTMTTPGITMSEAETLLGYQLARVEAIVNSSVKVPLTQNQFDALVSFVYNVGAGNFGTSTLLKKLNEKCYSCAGQQFLVWNKGRVNGELVTISGLTTRRFAERTLFLS